MATLAQLLAANKGGSSALVAAALRKGQVKTSDLVQPGMYDPALDWQAQNEALGFSQQYGTEPGNLNPGSDYNVQGSRLHEKVFGGSGSYVDPVTGQRTDYSTPGGLAELATQRQRGQENYNIATSDLQRNYQRLGTQQAGATRAAGAAGGGALHQALLKRQGNQAHDQSGLDASWRRMVDDNELARNNLLADAGQAQGKLDRGLSDATSSHGLFNQQLGEGRVQSAQQLGTLPDLPTPDMTHGTAGSSQAFRQMGVPSTARTFIGDQGTFIKQPAVGGGFWHIYENGKRVRVKG